MLTSSRLPAAVFAVAAAVPPVEAPRGRPTQTTPTAFAYPEVSVTFRLPHAAGRALLSAIEDIRDLNGGRLCAQTHFAVEDAWTSAAVGLGIAAKALRDAGLTEDADYAR